MIIVINYCLFFEELFLIVGVCKLFLNINCIKFKSYFFSDIHPLISEIDFKMINHPLIDK